MMAKSIVEWIAAQPPRQHIGLLMRESSSPVAHWYPDHGPDNGPVLWPTDVLTTDLIMAPSCGPLMSWPDFLESSSVPEVVFPYYKENSAMLWPCSETLMFSLQSPLWNLRENLPGVPIYHGNSNNTELAPYCDSGIWLAYIAANTSAEASFIQAPLKTGSLLSHLIKGLRITPKCGFCSKIQNSNKHSGPFFIVRLGAKYVLKGLSRCA